MLCRNKYLHIFLKGNFLIVYFQHASLEDIQKNIRELEIDDTRKKELACALHAQFKDWLYGELIMFRCNYDRRLVFACFLLTYMLSTSLRLSSMCSS